MAIENQAETRYGRDPEKMEIWQRIGSLIIRGGNVSEILNIADEVTSSLQPNVVQPLIEIARGKSLHGSNYLKIVDIKRGGKIEHPIAEDQEAQAKKIQFARELFIRGFIPPNNLCADDLICFCKDNNVGLPSDFYDMLRLEMYFGAITLTHMGNDKRLKSYEYVGRKIDPQWFRQSLAKEEKAIKEALYKKWADSNNRATVGKEPIRIESGKPTFETPESMCWRQELRWGIATTGEMGGQNGSAGRVYL